MEGEIVLLRQFVSNNNSDAFSKIIKRHAPMVILGRSWRCRSPGRVWRGR